MNLKVKRFLIRVFDKSIKTDWRIKFMLCLSMLFCVVYLPFNLGTALFQSSIRSFVGSNSWPTMLYFYKENMLFFLSSTRMMYILCTVAALFLIYGVVLMWRGFKWGLLFYTIGKTFQILLPILFLGRRMLAIGDIMIALLFLVFYYVYSFSHQIDKQERKYNQIKVLDDEQEG